MNPPPKIVTMCGSTRFADLMAAIAWEYEKLGIIALRVNYLPDWYYQMQGWTQQHHAAELAGLKAELDELHCRKIDMCTFVYVCNYNGYIGESTAKEIAYAVKIGKPVYYCLPNVGDWKLCPYTHNIVYKMIGKLKENFY